jgi:hypothetical protein
MKIAYRSIGMFSTLSWVMMLWMFEATPADASWIFRRAVERNFSIRGSPDGLLCLIYGR